MAKRTRKSTALSADEKSIAVYVSELPGAAFYGVRRSYIHVTDRFGATHEVDATSITAIDPETLAYAARLQEIRREYENDDCQAMLWHDLSQMGFSSREISAFVANPAAITNCGYMNAK
jgi:phosphopantetheine adenylyltransferase